MRAHNAGGRKGWIPLTWASLCRHASPTGLLLTVVVAFVYMVAIQYEE